MPCQPNASDAGDGKISASAERSHLALGSRWPDHAVPIYQRHGLHSIGWRLAEEKNPEGNDQFVCLLAGDSADAIQRFIGAFHQDANWQRVEKESEQNGKLQSNVVAYKLIPADFSALK